MFRLKKWIDENRKDIEVVKEFSEKSISEANERISYLIKEVDNIYKQLGVIEKKNVKSRKKTK